ncbi:MAG: hypothetical protein V5A84_03970 [Planctomycetota bacterium]
MTTTQDRDITERTVPLILIGAGVLLILVQAIVSPGELGVLGMFGARMVGIIVGSVFALLACYATAAVFNISFGLL